MHPRMALDEDWKGQANARARTGNAHQRPSFQGSVVERLDNTTLLDPLPVAG